MTKGTVYRLYEELDKIKIERKKAGGERKVKKQLERQEKIIYQKIYKNKSNVSLN
ncbi:MAG TPA: hypothetical protein VJH75_04175 [Patescibacteria group bacterium]|nr:hypothetical protein [Patescibacteria group bacterium]